jgi:aryl-alcohol dehydrogenase-like predicted oxidoreductase
MIEGFATPEATAAYARGRSATAVEAHFRRLDDCAVASVGIGTYLGAEDAATDAAYRAAIARALALGANVVDTAINYRCQRSERAVGAALRDLIGAGRLRRDEVLVATKGGFIPFDGDVPADPGRYVVETYIRSGIVSPGEVVSGAHCLAPRYLADQLERSRQNLGLATIDVYYLHNPETQLGAVGRDVFRSRLRAAFTLLEEAVAAGKIRRYGTATWTGYRQPPTAHDHLALAEVVQAARDVGGDAHAFRVIQLPYNLAMPEAFTLANQRLGGELVPVLQAADRLGLYVMASASVYQGQLTRNLPPVVAEFLPGLATDAQRALQFVRSTPGIGTALVGMKSVAHADDNLGVAAVPPLRWSEFRRLFSAA